MFAEALAAWLAFLASLGIDMQLNPPASAQQIAAAESEIGFRLPDDLRALYGVADGQREPFETVPGTGFTATGFFFGRYAFASLEEALTEYRSWREIHEEAGADFAATYDWTRARAGDPVHPDYWRPGWFPFATDGGGNAYAVDLSPPPGGTYGQVIVIGRDEDERRVLAPSLTEFLRRTAQTAPRIDGRDGRFVSFDMEPRP
jgi:cell wall assembly regulator SMI1